jgi:DNA-binding transcriptional ArsR family regulator
LADLDDWGIDPSLFQAMSHPLRVQILGDLSLPGATWSPSDYAEEVRIPLSKVAYHFRELLKFGLIEVCRERPVRGSVEHFYRAKKSALFANAPAWEKLPGIARTSVAAKAWGGYMGVGKKAIEEGAFDRRPDANFSWGTMRVDEQGWADVQSSLARALREMFTIREEAAKRIDGGAEGFDATYGLGGFESPPVEPGGDEPGT